MERGWPSGNEPVAVANFIADHRAAILGQSMFFLLSSGLYLWFLGSLRSFLLRAEGGTGRLSTVAFGAGIAWVGLSMVAQSFQVGMAMGANGEVQPVALWTMSAMFAIANLPCAVMPIAVAVVSLRYGAFPVWVGWLSMVAAAAQLLLWCGAIVDSGPLAPTGWLSYVLYPMFLVWLVPTTVIMIKRLGSPTARTSRANE